jgi:hypothetical protein
MQGASTLRRKADQQLRPFFSNLLVDPESFVDTLGVGGGEFLEGDAEDGGIFDGLGSALVEMGKGWVAGVAY